PKDAVGCGSGMRAGRAALGLAFIGAGCWLLGKALDRQTATALVPQTQAVAPTSAPLEPSTTAPPEPAAPALPVAAAADAAATAPEAGRGVPDGGTSDGVQTFHFATASAQLPNDEQQRLVALAKRLAKTPGTRVTVEGFGDEAGEDRGPKGLGHRRAAGT